jgi:DNA-binding NarL/FixJ family response regulator
LQGREKILLNHYRIVLADEHGMFRRGVKRILQDNVDLEVMGEAADGLQLLRIIKKSPPDMVITDVSLRHLRGLEATEEIKMAFPEIKVILLTMHRNKEFLYHALAAGAEGYLLKQDADIELFSAITIIRKGGIYISPLLAPQLKAIFMERNLPGNGQIKISSELLSTREREIIKLVAEGKSSKEIGVLLYISDRTVHHHRAKIMRKLNVKMTADLVKYAIKKGYTSMESS